MSSGEGESVDLLAEATGGKLHWNDPGMDAPEQGWEGFILGKRVEVRTPDGGWVKGKVVETPKENDRGIVVEADNVVSKDLDFHEGKGLSIPVYGNTKRGILSNIRAAGEESENVEV